MNTSCYFWLSGSLAALFFTLPLHAADQPQWGEAWSRNLVSSEKGLPDSFDPETGKNIKWVAHLGTQSHSTPIVAGGRVYIGTNNEVPRDPARAGDRGVLLCLSELDGHLLWQYAIPKRDEDPYFDWPKTGLASAATVEGDRVYVLDDRGQLVCLDANGMANGNDGPFKEEGALYTPHLAPPPEFIPSAVEQPLEIVPTDADVIWTLDLPSAVGIWPHDSAHASVLILGDYLYVNTGNGVDNTHRVIRKPDAPSLIVVDKKTGRLVARDQEHIGDRIVHATWASPSLATVGGRDLIVFAGGDGVVRGFKPFVASASEAVADLEKVWQYDIDPTGPKEDIHRFTGNKQQSASDIYGMPVIVGTRMFVAGGGDVFWGKNQALLKCVDLASAGPELKEVWSCPLEKHTMSTAAVSDGLVFVTATGRKIHCVEEKTGLPVWTQDTKGDFWSSPLVADGKVYAGTRKGDFWILSASKDQKVLSMFDFKKPISATATAANGVLYIATMSELYAIQQGAGSAGPAK